MRETNNTKANVNLNTAGKGEGEKKPSITPAKTSKGTHPKASIADSLPLRASISDLR